MRALLLLACLLPAVAPAELYRWVDRETGSVKFSNLPPPSTVGPVERLPFSSPGAPRAGAEPSKPPPAPSALALLEARRQQIRSGLAAMPAGAVRGPELARQLEAYGTVRTELDRVDPAGAQRRRAEDEQLFQQLARGVETQGNPVPGTQR